jgi:hypothetical protein
MYKINMSETCLPNVWESLADKKKLTIQRLIRSNG